VLAQQHQEHVTIGCSRVGIRRLEFVVAREADTQWLRRLVFQQPAFARARVATNFAAFATVVLHNTRKLGAARAGHPIPHSPCNHQQNQERT